MILEVPEAALTYFLNGKTDENFISSKASTIVYSQGSTADVNLIKFSYLPCRASRGKINLPSTILWLPELFTIRTKTPKQTNNIKQLPTVLEIHAIYYGNLLLLF